MIDAWKTIRTDDVETFRRKALHWASGFEVCTYLDSNGIAYPQQAFENLLAVGTKAICLFDNGQTFYRLQQFYQQQKDWIFGHFTYDLKNETEALHSQNPNRVNFPDAFFYVPEYLIRFSKNAVHLYPSEKANELLDQIQNTNICPVEIPPPTLQQRTSYEKYIRSVNAIKEHIIEGDIYELNYCIEFFAENSDADPLFLYERLNAVSPTPFSTFHKVIDKYLLCASPERFIKKTDQQLISQPIKGTIKRGQNPEEDQALQLQLRQDEKEIAENMMIVDLVRNDLARSCEFGSVKVPELFGIYAFRQVHQMISTVTGTLRKEVPFTQAIRNAFPMGSMTGAPKIRAMELIERYEDCQRGLYSGSVGYITPEGDFDFNVVIRSILYNQASRYLSFQIGSAITYDALAEKEYQECVLKAQGILKALGVDRLPSQ
ncbi:anthranilate synthase component I family protein [Rapidithrix thailandica]|uniref:Anthranilate synthase component I family protein n=1 Tax=Rapidithrix thailandica TaxID=413964 RepID=A0AAW9S524_9BACT